MSSCAGPILFVFLPADDRPGVCCVASAAEEGLSVDKQSLPVAERAPKSKAGGIALGVEEFR